MATGWRIRTSWEHHVRTEAERTSEAHHFSTLDGKYRFPDYEDSGDPPRDAKDSSPPRNHNMFSRSRSRDRAEDKRSGTAGQFSSSKSRSKTEADKPKRLLRRSLSRRSISRSVSADQDPAELPPPQLARLNCDSLHGDASMIGVAVGSPSQLQPVNPAWLGPTLAAKTETEFLTSSHHLVEESTAKVKGARWKKLGGLFKPRHAFPREQVSSPFYKLQVQHAAGEHQLPASSQTQYHSALPVEEATFLFGRRLGVNGQLQSQPSMVSLLQRGHEGGRGVSDSAKSSYYTSTQRPLLDVEIPEVRMERYSVMFEDLFDKEELSSLPSKNKKASNKLLNIPRVDEVTPTRVGGRQRHLETSETAPRNRDLCSLTSTSHTRHTRRATSPTPWKSPSFSLFPPLPQPQQKLVDQIPTTKQSPLRRSFTAPARMSPMQEIFNPDETQTPSAGVPQTSHKIVSSSQQPVSAFDPNGKFTNPSAPLSTSNHSFSDEQLPLNVESLTLMQKRPNKFELDIDQELRSTHLEPRNFALDVETGLVKRPKVEDEIQNEDWTDAHEGRWEFLQRPRSTTLSSRDISPSVKPSKAHIDRRMHGPSPGQLREAPARVSRSQGSPESPENNGNGDNPQQAVNAPTQGTQFASDVQELITSATSGAVLSANKQPAALSPGKVQPSVLSFSRPRIEPELRSAQQPMANLAKESQDSSDVRNPRSGRPKMAMNTSAKGTQNSHRMAAGQTPCPSQAGRGKPPFPTNNIEAQLSTAEVNTTHQLHYVTDILPLNRPTVNSSNKSSPGYRPLDEKPNLLVQSFYDQIYPSKWTNPRCAPTPPEEKGRDNILNLYINNTQAHISSHQPKSPKKLQKRPSANSKKPLTYPKSRPDCFCSSEAAVQPHVTRSKFSDNAAAFHNPCASPANSTVHRHSRSHSYWSATAKPASVEPRPFVLGTPAGYAQASPLSQPSFDEGLSMDHNRKRSISTPPIRRPRGELGSMLDSCDMVRHSETSFYSHSSCSTPILTKTSSQLKYPTDSLDMVSHGETSFYSHSNCSTPILTQPSLQPKSPIDSLDTVTRGETSFYSHSNRSTPILAKTSSQPKSPSQGLWSGFTKPEEKPATTRLLSSRGLARPALPTGGVGDRSPLMSAKPPSPKIRPNRGLARSVLPTGAGNDGPTSRISKPTPPLPPLPSSSAGIPKSVTRAGVAAGAAISGIGAQCLKLPDGGKIVERQAGSIPRIVDPTPEMGHRAGRSVNVVIESVPVVP